MTASASPTRIGIVAPAGVLLDHTLFDRLRAVVDDIYGGAVEILIHDQCRLVDGHFAGSDEARMAALVEFGNRPDIDAMWMLRGGYGSNRIAGAAIARLGVEARKKRWLGYSDIGFLLAGLQRAGFPHVAHGPMPVDLDRHQGRAAITRALQWLTEDASGVESSEPPERSKLAFNLTVLSQLLGTPLEPDFTGRVLMIEDTGDYLYRYDRFLFHITSNANVRRCAGIREGRFNVDANPTATFREPEGGVVADWCRRSGIPYFGRADIGHDSDNKVVPFG
jgi:muramoyltetrapeptide carboxypeptidase